MTYLVLALAGGLSLGLSAPKRCLPLESVPVVISYRATEDLPSVVVAGGAAFPLPLYLEIEGHHGTTLYRVDPKDEPVYAREHWEPGTKRSQQVLLGYGQLGTSLGVGGYPFPVAGSYRLRARYDDSKVGLHAKSDWVHVTVVDPTTEADALVLDGLRRGVAFNSLRAAHPGSRYFASTRLAEIATRSSLIHNGVDPETGLRADVARSELPAWRKARYEEVVAALEAEAGRSENVEREALARAQVVATHIGDGVRAAALEARLNAKYPGWRDVPNLE